MLVGTLFAVFSPATWLPINVGKDAAILVGKAVLAHAAILADIVALVVGLLRRDGYCVGQAFSGGRCYSGGGTQTVSQLRLTPSDWTEGTSPQSEYFMHWTGIEPRLA